MSRGLNIPSKSQNAVELIHMSYTLFSLTNRKDQLRSYSDDSCSQPFINQMSSLGHKLCRVPRKTPLIGFTVIFVMIQEDTITASHTNYNYGSHFSGMPMLVCLANFRATKTNTFFGLRKEFAIIEVQRQVYVLKYIALESASAFKLRTISYVKSNMI